MRLQSGREARAEPLHRLIDQCRRRHRIGVGRQIERDADGGAAVDAGDDVVVLRPHLDPRDVAHARHRAVGIGSKDDAAELLRGGQAPLRLHVHLELLVVAHGARADAPHRRLHVLRLDGVDDVGRRQVEAGEPLRIEPDAHGVVELAEQQRLADARHAGQLIENVDRSVAGDEDRRELGVVAIEGHETQHGRGALQHREALELHLLRQLRRRALDAIVDVDRVDVGVGAGLEADGQIVAAVVAARRLHVDHLVDADDLRFERLGDGGLDHRGRGARIIRSDLDARRHDIGKLRDGNAQNRNQAGDRDDHRDDDGEPRPANEDRRDHCRAVGAEAGCGAPAAPTSVCASAAGPGATGWPGRTRWMPSTITDFALAEAARHDRQRRRRRGCAQIDAPLLRLVVFADDIDIVAALVGQHRGAGHRRAPPSDGRFRGSPLRTPRRAAGASSDRPWRWAASDWAEPRARRWCRCCRTPNCRGNRARRSCRRAARRAGGV